MVGGVITYFTLKSLRECDLTWKIRDTENLNQVQIVNTSSVGVFKLDTVSPTVIVVD